MRTQSQAIGLGAIGLVLASGIPAGVVYALTPRADPGASIYTQVASTGWVHFADLLIPWIKICGLTLAAFAVVILFRRSFDPLFLSPIRSRFLTMVVATILGVFLASSLYLSPPHLGDGAFEFTRTVAKARDGAVGTTSWSPVTTAADAPVKRDADDAPDPTPNAPHRGVPHSFPAPHNNDTP